MTAFKGQQSRFSNKPLGLDITQSCATGTVIPEPKLMR